MPNAAGRRALPSELEKAIMREKETVEMQYAQAKTDLQLAQSELQQASATQHREVAATKVELQRVRAERTEV